MRTEFTLANRKCSSCKKTIKKATKVLISWEPKPDYPQYTRKESYCPKCSIKRLEKEVEEHENIIDNLNYIIKNIKLYN